MRLELSKVYLITNITTIATRLIFIGLSAFGVACCPAWAEKDHAYVAFFIAPNVISYIDVKTIVEMGDRVQVWELDAYYPGKREAYGLEAYSMTLKIINCKSRENATKHIVAYDLEGNVLVATPPLDRLTFESVVPDSRGELALKMACGAWKTTAVPPIDDSMTAVLVTRQYLAGKQSGN